MSESHTLPERRTPPSTDPSPETGSPGTRPEGPESPAGPRIHLSATAVEKIRELMDEARLPEEGGLRLRMRLGAGCSGGIEYGMILEEGPRRDDTVLASQDLRIFLDPSNAWALDGLEVDYVKTRFMGSGFAFRNPNTPGRRSC